MSAIAYIGFGANMGDREATFQAVMKALSEAPDTELKSWSRLYETDPVGLVDGGSTFLNGAIGVETGLLAEDLLAEMREVEIRLGKSLSHRSDLSRPVDLDLLLYGEEIIQKPCLEVPHPRMHFRGFVLAPLAEIASEASHPVLDCTVATLLKRLPVEELNSVRCMKSPIG